MKKAIAKITNLRVAPRKTRLVCSVIRSLPVAEALAQLQTMPHRAAPAIVKLLKSAVSNAQNKGMDVDKLIVETITVDKGMTLKRSLPRARGMATPIHKVWSHVAIILAEKEGLKAPRFSSILGNAKKAKKAKPAKVEKVSKEETSAEKAPKASKKPTVKKIAKSKKSEGSKDAGLVSKVLRRSGSTKV
jgi:large subunit ribosomal protein L22